MRAGVRACVALRCVQSEAALRHETQKANTRFAAHVRVSEDKLRELSKRYDQMEARLQVRVQGVVVGGGGVVYW
jgi:hypothetical protein